ncbi:unnamed protein product, partial [Protopolystoma xenopodis]
MSLCGLPKPVTQSEGGFNPTLAQSESSQIKLASAGTQLEGCCFRVGCCDHCHINLRCCYSRKTESNTFSSLSTKQNVCDYGEWRTDVACSATCDGVKPLAIGVKHQVRPLIHNAIWQDDYACVLERYLPCNISCTVDCQVIKYSEGQCTIPCRNGETEECSQMCGLGLRQLIPEVIRPSENGGRDCEKKYEVCDLGDCTGGGSYDVGEPHFPVC